MKQKIQLLNSGIPLVDDAWGGFYLGGTYLLIGSHKSGKTLLGLQYALECAKQKEVCLYFTSMRPKDLMIQAASIDFDLQQYMNQNLVILVRVAPPANIQEVENHDEFLVEYLKDIVTVVEQYQPKKVVFDELTPFIGFNDVNLLQQIYIQTTEAIEDAGITSLFLLGDPATPGSKQIVDALVAYSTGIVYLQKQELLQGSSQSGSMIITPNIGHTEGQFKSNYSIEPYKGITVDYKGTKLTDRTSVSKQKTEKGNYINLSDIKVTTDNIAFPNYYTVDEFKLILNNQVALYKSTGQAFVIVSFKLDPEAVHLKLLTINQLQNIVRLSTEKKDKICIIDDKVFVLITREEQKNINTLIARVKDNIQNDDKEFIEKVTSYISVLSYKVDENIQNSDDVFKKLGIGVEKENNNYGFK